jgi:hypothetical protein
MLTDPTSLDLSAFPAKLRGAVSALLRDNTALKSSNVELTEDRIALATQNAEFEAANSRLDHIEPDRVYRRVKSPEGKI